MRFAPALLLALAACAGDPTAPVARVPDAPSFSLAAPTNVTAAVTDCPDAKYATVHVAWSPVDGAGYYRVSINTPGTHDLAGSFLGPWWVTPVANVYAYALYGTWDIYVESEQWTGSAWEFSANSPKLTLSVARKDCPKGRR